MSEKWLVLFAVNHPDFVRKFGKAKQSAMLYKTEAILKAIENKEGIEK